MPSQIEKKEHKMFGFQGIYLNIRRTAGGRKWFSENHTPLLQSDPGIFFFDERAFSKSYCREG